MGTPISLSLVYTDPCWREYNQGLSRVTDESRSKGPVVATGCGHFIQRDDPAFVVEELSKLLNKVHSSSKDLEVNSAYRLRS